MSTKEFFTEKQKRLARYAKALGHPIRIYVMETLSKQSCCYSGDLTDILPIAGLIQGEIEAPKIKYCVNRENWAEAQLLFKEFLSQPTSSIKEVC